jgi:hypothetical protein
VARCCKHTAAFLQMVGRGAANTRRRVVAARRGLRPGIVGLG